LRRFATSFIKTVAEDSATGLAAELQERDRAALGYVPNYAKLFTLRPEVYEAWGKLNGALRRSMDRRRYELPMVAAATALRSSYCSLAHGRILAERFLPADQVKQIARDPEAAALDPGDRAVVDFARKVALRADEVTASDVDRLRSVGLTEKEIFEVVLAATLRCFFSKTLQATGTPPDNVYRALDPELRESLTVGGPIEESGTPSARDGGPL
jgi:uncharacterized peroxidase-related enzyme